MPSTVEDFKKLARKIVKLPSGLEVEIRRLTAFDFVDLGELPMPAPQPQTVGLPAEGPPTDSGPADPERTRKVRDYTGKFIVRAVISPPFSDKDEDLGNPAVVHVRDLALDDFNALGVEIAELAGVKKEVVADAESFRPDQQRPNSKGSGADVRQAPDRDPGSNDA